VTNLVRLISKGSRTVCKTFRKAARDSVSAGNLAAHVGSISPGTRISIDYIPAGEGPKKLNGLL
jgi:hypothetical protein